MPPDLCPRHGCSRPRRATAPGLLALLALSWSSSAQDALADDTSAADKLRILYSSRFTFTDDGLPLVTVEIASGMKNAKLSSKGGMVVRPDGAGGSAVEAAGQVGNAEL